MNDRFQRTPGLAIFGKTIAPEARRSTFGSVVSWSCSNITPFPNRSASFCRTSGSSSTACPTLSASIVAKPFSPSNAATALLPLATPPVRPTIGIVPMAPHRGCAAREIARPGVIDKVLLSTGGRNLRATALDPMRSPRPAVP